MQSPPTFVIDADDSTFDEVAIRASSQQPVVVDFWAPWCAPCRTLGPLLESLASEFAGAFLLVKVDTESAPQTAQQFDVRSIPAVVGIRDQEIVAEFVGAQPETAVRAFLNKLIPSSAADEQTRTAQTLTEQGRNPEAEQAYRAALELEAGHPAASLGLAQLLFARDDLSGAHEILDAVRPGSPVEREIERLQTAVRVRDTGDDALADLEIQVRETPGDLSARVKLAAALAADNRLEDALCAYLEVLKIDPDFDDQAARRGMLELFEILGSDHDLTRSYRGQLARLLYR
ncbi:MAG: tetratricopeptide repeat protein [Deltaproteobacteria bacterium]|nr:tetratricopeptide repeat protein [Deltaproteobacteria bacterium]